MGQTHIKPSCTVAVHRSSVDVTNWQCVINRKQHEIMTMEALILRLTLSMCMSQMWQSCSTYVLAGIPNPTPVLVYTFMQGLQSAGVVCYDHRTN